MAFDPRGRRARPGGRAGGRASAGGAHEPSVGERVALAAATPEADRSAEQGPRIEALDRDDADPRQRDGEGADVVLQVEEGEAVGLQVGERGRDELAEADHADAPLVLAVEQRRKQRREVAVVRGEHHVAVATLRERLEGPQDRDVDHLHVRRAAKEHRAIVERRERLDERHRDLAGRVQEEQRADGLIPHGARVLAHAIPARPLLRRGPPAKQAAAERRVDVLAVDEQDRLAGGRRGHRPEASPAAWSAYPTRGLAVRTAWFAVRTGISALPTGRSSFPAGRSSFPTGRFRLPTRRFLAPTRRLSLPTGRFSLPVGRFSLPTLRFLFPTEDFLIPTGKSRTPSVQLEFPIY